MRASLSLAALVAATLLSACEPPEPAPPPPGDGDTAALCGGLQGLSCGADQYCSYPATARCGAADQTGVCMPRPEACTMEYAPVCGCDGETYGNACTAAAEGVSVAHAGECT